MAFKSREGQAKGALKHHAKQQDTIPSEVPPQDRAIAEETWRKNAIDMQKNSKSDPVKTFRNEMRHTNPKVRERN